MLLVLSILGVLVISFFCSLSEASLLSIGRARVEIVANRSASGRVIRRMKENLERPIAAILILNTVANTGGAALAGSEYRSTFGDGSMVLFGLSFTLAVLLFSEFIPKSIGVRFAERSALLIAGPLELVVQILRPLTWLVSSTARLFGLSGHRSASVSIDDLRAMARLAASAKVLGREELMIIEAASQLPRIPVHHLMIHSADIVFFSLAEQAETNLRWARRSLHSRMLVCGTDLGDIQGVVNMKEVLWSLAEDPAGKTNEGLQRILDAALREPLYVDPETDIPQLIQLFAQHHDHLAVVRDKAGKVVGMVTLEDVVEELMGEIDDEYDRIPDRIDALGAQWWRVGGGALWSEVQAKLGMPATERPEADLDGRVDMNDYVAERLRGHLRTGGAFRLGEWWIKVVRMRRGKVVLVDVVGPGGRPGGGRARFGSSRGSTDSVRSPYAP